MPDSTRGAVWYALYPLGFTGAPIRGAWPAEPAHRLRQVINWLDHIKSLGCTGLLLGPIFTSASHGYDTLNHFSIDPRLGDIDDFGQLVEQCHQRGIRVMLDGVFNHLGERHPTMVRALADPHSEVADWFFINYEADPRHWLNFEGSNDLVRLNHANPAVAEYVYEVMVHWLARGIDGWRLDAAYAVAPELWATVVPRVKAEFPNALFVGEVIHRDDHWLATSTIESITAYELWKAIWAAIHDRNFFELDWTLGRHNELLDQVAPLTFVSNHDVTRIATQVESSSAGIAGCVAAAAILMTVGGMPAIYYGDEGGLRATKYDRPGGDDDIRTQLPASPTDWVPPEPWLVSEHRQLIELRHEHAWLDKAKTQVLALTNERIVYRAQADDEWLDVEVDLTEGCRVAITGRQGQCYWFESN